MLLEVDDLAVTYETTRGPLYALGGVSLSLAPGETLGVVGESGCGKSTLGRALMGLAPISGGQVRFAGTFVEPAGGAGLRALRLGAAMVFQDPAGSLNPRRTVGSSIAQPLRLLGIDRREAARRVLTLLDDVGLPSSAAQRYPHEFSGGQRQRIGIARALARSPKLLICDEAVSALDVSVRAQVVNLLQQLQRERGIALLFISHDLGIVEHIAQRMMVMYLGRAMETGPTAEMIAAPAHPYTRLLLDSVPVADPRVARQLRDMRPVLDADLPSPLAPPSGCPFRTRCPRVEDRCAVERPLLRTFGQGRMAACHNPFVLDANEAK